MNESISSWPTEPHYEPLVDDLPWEEPIFEYARPLEDAEADLDADGPSDDEPSAEGA